jgi:hypothetical protein
MKIARIFLIGGLFILVIQTEAFAQNFKVGAGTELRSDPAISMFVKASYDLGFLDENLSTSLDLMFLPPIEANLDFHYSFFREFGFDAFGLAGVNWGDSVGANVGAGVLKNIAEEKIDVFGEVKYLINNNPQASIKIGLFYNI